MFVVCCVCYVGIGVCDGGCDGLCVLIVVVVGCCFVIVK